MSVYKPRNSPFWHYDFVIQGRRFHGSTGQTAKTGARKVEAEARRRAAAPPGREPITLDDAAGAWFAARIQGRATEATATYQVQNLLDGLGARKFLSEISQGEILRYTQRRRARVSDSSVNRETETLRAIWRYAERKMRRETGETPDWAELLMPEPDPPKRELSTEEEARLLAAIRADLAPFIAFALATGLRLRECRTLRWRDVNLAARTILTTGKGGRVIAAPISRTTVALIAAQPKVGPFVFTYLCARSRGQRRKGTRYPLSQSGWRREWKAALAAAGIEGFRFHDLRHSFGTRLLRATGNLALVQKAMNHATIETTTRYAHVLDEDLREGLEAMESRNSPEAVFQQRRKTLTGND